MTRAKRYTREGMTEWQRAYRERKPVGECQENGCHNPATGYRCASCAAVHAERERQRAKLSKRCERR